MVAAQNAMDEEMYCGLMYGRAYPGGMVANYDQSPGTMLFHAA